MFCLSTGRIDERNIKVPITTCKCQPTTSELAGVFVREIANATKPLNYWVKVHKEACLVDVKEMCKLILICDQKVISVVLGINLWLSNEVKSRP